MMSSAGGTGYRAHREVSGEFKHTEGVAERERAEGFRGGMAVGPNSAVNERVLYMSKAGAKDGRQGWQE